MGAFTSLILAVSTATPTGIVAGIGLTFFAGFILFREIKRINKSDTLLDSFIEKLQNDNDRLRDDNQHYKDENYDLKSLVLESERNLEKAIEELKNKSVQ